MHPRAAHFKDCYLRLLATLFSAGPTAVSQHNLLNGETVAARPRRSHRVPPAKNIHGERQENRHQDIYVHVLESHQYYIDEKSILPHLSPLFLASLSPQSPGANSDTMYRGRCPAARPDPADLWLVAVSISESRLRAGSRRLLPHRAGCAQPARRPLPHPRAATPSHGPGPRIWGVLYVMLKYCESRVRVASSRCPGRAILQKYV